MYGAIRVVLSRTSHPGGIDDSLPAWYERH